jgi:histidine triad (HIT) family protein
MDDHNRAQCIFCRIADRDIPSPLLWEDNDVVAFNDLHPKAPVHILIIPRKHIGSLNDMSDEDMIIVGKISYVASLLAAKAGLTEDGWRLVCNCGKNAGQEVFHLHYHLLGGKYLGPFSEK